MKTDVEKILEAVSVTAELTGADLSENAKAAMVEALLPLPAVNVPLLASDLACSDILPAD